MNELTKKARLFWQAEIRRIGTEWDTAEIMATFAASHAAEAVKATLDDLVKAVEGMGNDFDGVDVWVKKADVLAEIEKLKGEK